MNTKVRTSTLHIEDREGPLQLLPPSPPSASSLLSPDRACRHPDWCRRRHCESHPPVGSVHGECASEAVRIRAPD